MDRERVTVFVDSTHILILHCTAVLSVSIYYTHLCIKSKPLLATVFEYEFMFVYSKLCIVSQTLNYLCYKILKLQTQTSPLFLLKIYQMNVYFELPKNCMPCMYSSFITMRDSSKILITIKFNAFRVCRLWNITSD